MTNSLSKAILYLMIHSTKGEIEPQIITHGKYLLYLVQKQIKSFPFMKTNTLNLTADKSFLSFSAIVLQKFKIFKILKRTNK